MLITLVGSGIELKEKDQETITDFSDSPLL